MRIAFTGDLSCSGKFAECVALGKEIFSSELRELLASCDHVVCNFEGPATAQKAETDYGFEVVSPPVSVPYLVSRGISVFNLGNNHVFDCGQTGFSETVGHMATAGARYFGAGYAADDFDILVVEEKGLRVALLSVTDALSPVAAKDRAGTAVFRSLGALRERVSFLRDTKKADRIVVNYHGGEEYTRIPLPAKRSLFRSFAALAVDAVVAHHSHVYQGYEVIDGKPVFYSLGNFIFDIPPHHKRDHTDTGALAVLEFTQNGLAWSIIPLRIDRDAGLVSRGDPSDELFSRLTLPHVADPHGAWLADAYRTLFNNRRHREGTGIAGPATAATGQRSLTHYFSLRHFKTLWTLFRAPDTRPVLCAALKFIVLRKLGLLRDRS
ncbi:MAG TPA: CapA family protein [bacterium]|nr:CapA family protein [bacterium]